MQFYKITAIILDNEKDEDTNKESRRRRQPAENRLRSNLARRCESYTADFIDKGYLFVSGGQYDDDFYMGMITREDIDIEFIVSNFFRKNKVEVSSLDIKETTLKEFNQLLIDADRYDFIDSDEDILREFKLDAIASPRRGPRYGHDFDEDIIRDIKNETIYKLASTYFTSETFIPELNRIFVNKENKYILGHPVDYIIESDDERTQIGMMKLLLQALYNAKRIKNRRYAEVVVDANTDFKKAWFESLYNSCAGGAVVLTMGDSDDNDDDDEISADYYYIEDLCKVIRRHSNDVLTIISMPRESTNLRLKLFEYTGAMSFVEIKEELAFDEDAITYLKKRAKEYKIRVDKKLLSSIETEHGYLVTELNGIFDEWYNQKLKNTVFSQYKDICCAKNEIKEAKVKGDAYNELNSMIGLKSAKKVITQALDCYKAQIIFKDKGLKEDSFCNHMIFTGNPGTAKTTVARLFARILKDNKVISKGQIIEVGRSDLVGKYVGWTAPTIKKKFKEASGGILFIDEAYSLVDDRDGSYGDEAINTIVQEMENHRDDVIVIFAGYPDKMEGFLDKNPGLKSRIAHYVHFEDYDTDELCQIAEFVAAKKGLCFDDKAKNKIRTIMEKASTQEDFGNGRYARNLVEKAKMAQNSRLVHMDYEAVTNDDVKRICEEDIELPVAFKKTSRQIGFITA